MAGIPSTISRLVLFISSFSPLLIVFALLDSLGAGWPSILCVLLAALSIPSLVVFLRFARKVDLITLKINIAKRRDVEMLTYVATFLVPFLTASTQSLRSQIALLIFIALIATFYIMGDMYFWNPVLGVIGYRAMEIEMDSQEIVTLITNRRYIHKNSSIKAIPLSHYVYWEPK